MYRKMTTGFFVPTESFKSIPEHIAIMYEDDQTLVGVFGPSDDEHVEETNRQARLFAASFELLEALRWIVEMAGYAEYQLNPEGRDKNGADYSSAISQALDAIAKARGVE